jgi:5-formyltetrahydrofolate cyclo-ligase
MKEKREIRKEVWRRLLEENVSKNPFGHIPQFKGQREAAEMLRKLEAYVKAKSVFVPPDQAQYEVRLNCLKDGKVLIMATPRLRDGFYKLDKDVKNWKRAVISYEVTKYGKRLLTSYEEIGKIDLMVTGAVAVSIRGERIGKGTGFFDLEFAILREIGSVDESTPIAAIVHPLQIYEKIPFEPKDVSINYIVTPEKIIEIKDPPPRPKGIDWKYAEKFVSKIRPLKELYEKYKLG